MDILGGTLLEQEKILMRFKIYSLTFIVLFFSYSKAVGKNNSPMVNNCEQWCINYVNRPSHGHGKIWQDYKQAIQDKVPDNGCNPGVADSMLALARNDCLNSCLEEDEYAVLKAHVEGLL